MLSISYFFIFSHSDRQTKTEKDDDGAARVLPQAPERDCFVEARQEPFGRAGRRSSPRKGGKADRKSE